MDLIYAYEQLGTSVLNSIVKSPPGRPKKNEIVQVIFVLFIKILSNGEKNDKNRINEHEW